MLPMLENDLEFLAGSHLTVASLHESLVHTKKRLAVGTFESLASRMNTPLCFPLFALDNVQLAAAGKVDSDTADLRVSKLVGPVLMKPAYREIINLDQDHAQNLEDLFGYKLPMAMRSFYDIIADKGLDKIKEHYDNMCWPVELVYASTDSNQERFRVVTNILHR